jgi:hypothetical protein
LGTAEDLGRASHVNHTWKEGGDAYYTQQEQADEPWFSLVCARFSEEVMGPIVEAMKDEKEKMEKEQTEGGKSGTETVSAEAATTSITMTMTPKRLWEECNKARQTKTENVSSTNTDKRPVPAHFNAPFPGLWMRVEIRAGPGGRKDAEGKANDELLAYRTFPFSKSDLLVDLYCYDEECSLSLTATEAGNALPRIIKETCVILTVVDLVEGNVAKALEVGESNKTICYDFAPTPVPELKSSYHNAIYVDHSKEGGVVYFGVRIAVGRSLLGGLDVMLLEDATAVNRYVRAALKGKFC